MPANPSKIRVWSFAAPLAATAGLLMLSAATAFAPQPASAQGWSDRGWSDDAYWDRPGSIGPRAVYPRNGRQFDVYPDDMSDDEIEEDQRASGSRSYEARPYRDGRWNDRYGDDEDREDRDDGGYVRRSVPWDISRQRRTSTQPSQPKATADGKPSAPTSGQFAPGPRPLIRAAAPPVVAFGATYPVGSIVIDTGARKLYYVRGHMSAYAYPIGVGREGFSWVGTEKVSRVADWPDWYPPADMRKRQLYLPERMLGGLNNPLGAKAIYLGNTLYRIHGTNDPASIGKAKSSGCFRMMNKHVTHLASLVKVGTQVTVVRSLGRGVNIVSAPSARSSARVATRNAERYRAETRDPEVRRWRNERYADPYYDRYRDYDGDDDYR